MRAESSEEWPGPGERLVPATLAEVLEARDGRAARQKELLARYGGAVISLTPVAPGSVKTGPRFLRIHELGRDAVLGALAGGTIRVLHEEQRRGPAGYETLFAVAGDAREIKRLAVRIEETHPAGRLFDIDVIGGDGAPFGRADLGLPGRLCLICGGPSGDCARSRAHPVEALLARIDEMLETTLRGG
jgi:holo-ACP synthase CitX